MVKSLGRALLPVVAASLIVVLFALAYAAAADAADPAAVASRKARVTFRHLTGEKPLRWTSRCRSKSTWTWWHCVSHVSSARQHGRFVIRVHRETMRAVVDQETL